MSLESLREAIGTVTLPRLERLQKDGHLTVVQGLARPAGRPRFERRVALAQPAEAARAHVEALRARSARSVAARILALLADRGDIALAEARDAGAAPGHLDGLERNGWIRRYEAQVERGPLAGMTFEARPPLVLTTEQQAAADAIWSKRGTWLLHGVTGSGKTEVYLDLVRRTLAEGKAAVVCSCRRWRSRPGNPALWETVGTRWRCSTAGSARGSCTTSGTRCSAAPHGSCSGPGVRCSRPRRTWGWSGAIDQEHEWTYKQENPQPRYHARDAARELCRLTGATLVLGSATPDIVTYHHSELGSIRRFELKGRVSPGEGGETSEGTLPRVTVVDMREQLKHGDRSVFSVPLSPRVAAGTAAERAVDPVP